MKNRPKPVHVCLMRTEKLKKFVTDAEVNGCVAKWDRRRRDSRSHR